MGRRTPEIIMHRRPTRKRASESIWWILGGFFFVAVMILFIFHHQYQDSSLNPTQDITDFDDLPPENLNFTKELLSTTSIARQLVDQISLAKAYVIIAKEHGNLNLAWELSTLVRNCQSLLSRASMSSNAITLEEALPKIQKLTKLIYKCQDLHYVVSTTISTLKKHVKALEERVIAASVQSMVFGQLASESIPKDIHCLTVKLSEEIFKNPLVENLVEEQTNSPRLVDNNLYHFCVFSNNVISTSVLVNSTIANAEHPQQFVFHIVTDEVNYKAMMSWFLENDFKGCTIDIRKIEDLTFMNDSDMNLHQLRFYIPEMHPLLEKVVFLEDDVVVQKDLTPLFFLDMHGNIIGAVETCSESFHTLYRYLNFYNPLIRSRFDPQACAWAFGLNVFDLISWKNANATVRYRYWVENNREKTLWKDGTLSVGLLTFYGMVEPLDRRWNVLGLGFDTDVDERLIESAAAVHFSGYMKPWLKVGISKYKYLWRKYVDFAHPFIQDCFMTV